MASAEIQEPPAATTPLPRASAGGLLAVRLAGAAFASPCDLRSPAFEQLLEERGRLRGTLQDLRELLADEIFRAIPQTSDRTARRQLLAAKRAIHNDRPLEAPAPGVSAGLAALLARYGDLRSREEELFADGRAAVLREIRRQLRQVWDDPRFRLACRYASPDLVADIEGKGLPEAGELTSAERGVYAFLSRWMSKANPFHLFAEVAFPPSARIPVDGDHEVVLHAGDLLAHERRLLQRAGDPRRISLQLVPFQSLNGHLLFWVPAPAGFQLVSQDAGDPCLRATIDFFAQRRRHGMPAATVAEWREYVAGPLDAEGLSRAEESLAGWCRQGIVRRFLIADLDRFAPALQGIAPEHDESLARLQSLHLARLSTAELASASAAVPGLDPGLDPEGAAERSPVRYYVNSYRRLETAGFEAAAAELRPALADLKPFFSPRHNFDRYAFVIESYFLDYLAHRSERRALYLEILRHFLRHRQEIIRRYQPEIRLPEAELRRRQERSARLAGLAGRLDPGALRGLEPSSEGALPSLCFNGPMDFVERTFYVTNVFAGEGRFVSRYLLHRRREAAAPANDDGDLHVELAVPPEPNLNYVVPRYPAGCGFEARYAHRFERWVDPAEILIEREEDGIAYRDAVSGRRLRLHYRGFQLAHLLPAEYQLLLIGHADTFHNPFQPLPRPPGDGGGGRHDPGLFYGPVCLRRESWSLDHDFWRDLLAERDSLRLTARLRERVHARLKPEELWYYHGLGEASCKPRLLDLRNPLSALALQHAVAASPPGVAVTMSAMQPPPPHLYHRDGAPVVTELMIEV